jgi:hypothetical protein
MLFILAACIALKARAFTDDESPITSEWLAENEEMLEVGEFVCVCWCSSVTLSRCWYQFVKSRSVFSR